MQCQPSESHSEWAPFSSSLREEYDSLVENLRSRGLDNVISWENFLRDFTPLVGHEIPTEYRHYDVRVSEDGEVIELYKGTRRVTNLSQGG